MYTHIYAGMYEKKSALISLTWLNLTWLDIRGKVSNLYAKGNVYTD